MKLGRCFDDAFAVYGRNWIILFVAAVLHEILSLVTLLVLAGPLYGGICLMTLRAMRSEDNSLYQATRRKILIDKNSYSEHRFGRPVPADSSSKCRQVARCACSKSARQLGNQPAPLVC